MNFLSLLACFGGFFHGDLGSNRSYYFQTYPIHNKSESSSYAPRKRPFDSHARHGRAVQPRDWARFITALSDFCSIGAPIGGIFELVGKYFQLRAKNRALMGKRACKNATPSERKNLRGAEGAAHTFAHCLCRVFARAIANLRTSFGTMLK